MDNYNPAPIEKKWQDFFESVENNLFFLKKFSQRSSVAKGL